MTEEIRAAEDAALLSGRRARWAMFILGEISAIAAVVIMLRSWSDALLPLFVGSLALASVGPALNLLVPAGMRAEYARQMADLVQQRNEAIASARTGRDLLPPPEPRP